VHAYGYGWDFGNLPAAKEVSPSPDKPHLYLIEGIPGAGKTTTAKYVHGLLIERGRRSCLRLEGDIDHPADFEAAACLSRCEYVGLLTQYPRWGADIEGATNRSIGEHMIVSYGRLRRLIDDPLPAGLLDYLRRHDAVDGTDRATYRGITVDRWQRFAQAAAAGSQDHVFECCFLQNPTTVLMCRHNTPVAEIEAHIQTTAAAIRVLAPCLIYLRQSDVRGTLERVAAQRPRAWLDFVIEYVTGQGWAIERGLSGLDGVVSFYQARQEIELGMLGRLSIPHLVLDPAVIGWEATRAAIGATLDERAPMDVGNMDRKVGVD